MRIVQQYKILIISLCLIIDVMWKKKGGGCRNHFITIWKQ